ncbi:hypothetical protein LTR85_007772 [Meristemomyces frigidus]|nr:hypothetical protein LTR85_007772 [Meristemomyces frigidus]
MAYTAHQPLQVKQPCRFFALPQELLDMIFDFAYPHEPGVRLLDRKQWQEKQKACRRLHRMASPYMVQPFPPPKVNSFLISKRYFQSAAKAWVQNHPFDDTKLDGTTQLFDTKGIIRAYTKKLTSHLFQVKYLDGMPALRVLRIQVNPHDFERLEPQKLAWQDELGPEEFRRLMIDERRGPLVAPWLLAQLQDVEAVAEDCRWAKDAEEKAMWARNVRAFTEFLRARASEEAQVIARRGPVEKAVRAYFKKAGLYLLYPGSEVSHGNARAVDLLRYLARGGPEPNVMLIAFLAISIVMINALAQGKPG